MRIVFVIASVTMMVTASAAGLDAPGNATNPQAVAEVANGARDTANAAWWGFNEEDSTEAVQAACACSPAKTWWWIRPSRTWT